MNRLTNRLARVERLAGAADVGIPGRVHELIEWPGEDAAAEMAHMIAAGDAAADDMFIIRRIVEPTRSAA